MKELKERGPVTSWTEYLVVISESHEALGWVWRELINDKGRRLMKRTVAFMCLAVPLGLVPSWNVGRIVHGLSVGDVQGAWVHLGMLVACLMVAQLCHLMTSRNREIGMGEIHATTDRRLSELFYDKSVGQHLRENSYLSAGNLEKARQRAIGVIDMLAFQAAPQLTSIVAALVLLTICSPVAALVCLGLTLTYVIGMVFLNFRLLRETTPLDEEFRAQNRARFDRWDHARRVIDSGKGHEVIEDLDANFRTTLSKERTFWMWYIARSTGRMTAMQLALCGFLAMLIARSAQGQLAPSDLVPIFAWSYGLLNGLYFIGIVERTLYYNMPAVKAMRDTVCTPNEVPTKPDAIKLDWTQPLTIQLSGVAYAYRTDDGLGDGRHVLRDVSFSIGPGKKMALIGESGAGKSTVTRLLLRNMDPHRGRVVYNGNDLRDLDLNDVRRNVAFIAQDPPVLDDTLRENILFRIPRPQRCQTDEEILDVLKRVQLDLPDRFEKGLDTRVGRNGVKLSGGEKQRLMIAAAMIERARLVLIDEATSSLDSTTERFVQRELESLLGEGTCALVIAHRFSSIRFCDTFVVLKNARGLSDGEPQIEAIAHSLEELYAISPTFRRLADDQGFIARPAPVIQLASV